MSVLSEEIKEFLSFSDLDCYVQTRMGMEVLFVASRCVVPCEVIAESYDEAQKQAQGLKLLLDDLQSEGLESIVITEDRWRSQGAMMRFRLLAHLEIFTTIYARNCEVRKVDKTAAATFLAENHSYGDASCRYRYGLYLRRASRDGKYSPGTLVAVATFSNARKWQKGDKVVRSYEWTRYASLSGVRISGGMGKMLKAFIKEVHPDDIMSYADLEWSEGKVYEQLGFVLEGRKDPVLFEVDQHWRRIPVKSDSESEMKSGSRFFWNSGSNKYRMKLTEYE